MTQTRADAFIRVLSVANFLVDDLSVRYNVVLSVGNIDGPERNASCMFKPARSASPLVDQLGVACDGVKCAINLRGELVARSGCQYRFSFEIKYPRCRRGCKSGRTLDCNSTKMGRRAHSTSNDVQHSTTRIARSCCDLTVLYKMERPWGCESCQRHSSHQCQGDQVSAELR